MAFAIKLCARLCEIRKSIDHHDFIVKHLLVKNNNNNKSTNKKKQKKKMEKKILLAFLIKMNKLEPIGAQAKGWKETVRAKREDVFH